MATISTRAEVLANRSAYHMVRRTQASTAGYRHFDDGDLSKYLDRDSFQIMADRMANHYFHRSQGLAISGLTKDLYLAHLIMAPILQGIPLSTKYDWHRGHIIGFIRINANGKVRRFHYGFRTVERDYQPEMLAANIDLLGIHDAGFVQVLLDLYRRHAGGTTLKDSLAHQLFDPILMSTLKQGFELRHANSFIRLEKTPFPGSVDLRQASANVLDYQIRSVRHSGGYHLEIGIADRCVTTFRNAVKGILVSTSSPGFKIKTIETRIRDLVERVRPARSALPQILELKQWLTTKLRGLSGTAPEAKILPNLMINLWLQRSDSRLHLKVPNFFFNQASHDEKTFMTFFSPYREL